MDCGIEIITVVKQTDPVFIRDVDYQINTAFMAFNHRVIDNQYSSVHLQTTWFIFSFNYYELLNQKIQWK